MTLLNPKTAIALKNAKLPSNATKFTVLGKHLPQAALDRVNQWWFKASEGHGETLVSSDLDGWWSISETQEYGRTLWGPYIAQDPGDSTKAALILGAKAIPLSFFSDWRLVSAEDGIGFVLEWELSNVDYVGVPVRILKGMSPGLAELRKALVTGSDISKMLAKPVIMYPKLPSLPVGTYSVVGTFEFPGYNGPEKGLLIMVNGQIQPYQGNRETSETLALDPVISEDKPATLEIIGHGVTAQGYPRAIVKFSVDFDEDYGNFDLSGYTEMDPGMGLLAPGDDGPIADVEAMDLSALDSGESLEPAPTKSKAKRSR